MALPARTVTGSASQDWVRRNGRLRRLTFNEVKLLQGFPNDWIVEGTKAQQYKQIGNAVPAVFGEALGEVLVSHLANYPSGDPVRMGVPKAFQEYIAYKNKDHARNKASRRIHHHFERG